MLKNAYTRNVIIRLAHKQGYTTHALIRGLRCSEMRFKKKLSRPGLFTVEELSKIGGLLGVQVNVLLYMLLRGQETAGKTQKDKEQRYWYISEEIKKEGEQVYSSIQDKES
jgi:hypothetical protein